LCKKNLNKKIKTKDLSKLQYFIKIKIIHSQKGLFISQKKILDLLKETDKLGCKPIKTPIKINIKLNTEIDEPLKDINHFQRLIGKLIYLTITRSDLSSTVSLVNQFMHAPRTPHLDVINKILRYLKCSP
jgi:hypothetical protein